MMQREDGAEFEALLRAGLPDFSNEVVSTLSRFRSAVLKENEVQNLTRLTRPMDFFEGHVLDAYSLNRSGLVEYPAMDLGSGVGVPGILSAILGAGPWILAESEGRKAEFLRRTCVELGLNRVSVFQGRGEDYLRQSSTRVGSVVARAVGPVGRIYGWMRDCSTWNSLVLLKGPGWSQEWDEFQRSGMGRRLLITHKYEYSVGAERKTRIIVRLERK